MQQPKPPACIVLSFDDAVNSKTHPMAKALIKAGWSVVYPELRITGSKVPKNVAVRGAVDHNPAEHGVWIGRPLLGQWVWEVQCVVDWLRTQPINRDRVFLAGIGSASLIALAAAALAPSEIAGVITTSMPATYLTEEAYGPNWRMGLLVPGILMAGDIPHLAGLVAPRTLVITDGVDPQGKRLKESKLQESFAFTQSVYKAVRSPKLIMAIEPDWADMARKL